MTKPSQYPEKYTRPMRHIHHSTIVWLDSVELGQFFVWAWFAKAKGHSCHIKNQLLPKPFMD